MKLLICLIFLLSFCESAFAKNVFEPESRDLTVYTIKGLDAWGKENESRKYTYNENGKISEELIHYYDNDKYLKTYTYYEDGRLKSSNSQNFSDGEWGKGEPRYHKYWKEGEYSYEEVSGIKWFVKDSLWIDSFINIRKFNKDNLIISSISERFVLGVWINSFKRFYFYDDINNNTLTYSLMWNERQDFWEYYERHEYTYNDQNWMASYTYYDSDDSVWTKRNSHTVTYLDDGRVKTRTYYKLYISDWIEDYHNEYEYDENGYPTVYFFRDGEFQAKTIYEYSEHGQLTMITSIDVDQVETDIYAYEYDENLNLSKIEILVDGGNIGSFSDNRGRNFVGYGKTILINEGIVSVEDEPEAERNEVSLFPNPCSLTLHIDLSHLKFLPEQIAVIDLSGRTLKVQEINKNGQQTLSVNTDDLSPGIYFLKITANGKEITKKFIKQD
jgi:type IX secretion system substrate protein